jgi:hypothetical protein
MFPVLLYWQFVSQEGPYTMNLIILNDLKVVEKKSIHNSCYGLGAIKASHSKESVP